MKEMNEEEKNEIIKADFIERVKKQQIWDLGVKCQELVRVNGEYVPKDKISSTTQFHEKEVFEDMVEGEERKSMTAGRTKGEKQELSIEDKDSLKESLERQRRSPWIVRAYILLISAGLIGLMILTIVGHIYIINIFVETQNAYIYLNTIIQKTSELLYIKDNIRSLIFVNR